MLRWINRWNNGTKIDREIIKQIQRGMGIEQDGYFGEHTLDRIYRAYGQPEACYDGSYYNAYVITGKPENLVVGLSRNLPDNSISGTFQWSNKPVSTIIGEKAYCRSSAHAWLDKPDTVLYFDGNEVKEERTKYFDKDCIWAIGGLGLHNYEPYAEGYSGKYADVLRYTYHTAVGIYPDGYMILVYAKGTGRAIRSLMIDQLCCKYAIMLDGGHLAAINSEHYKRNLKQPQNNYVGFRR